MAMRVVKHLISPTIPLLHDVTCGSPDDEFQESDGVQRVAGKQSISFNIPKTLVTVTCLVSGKIGDGWNLGLWWLSQNMIRWVDYEIIGSGPLENIINLILASMIIAGRYDNVNVIGKCY